MLNVLHITDTHLKADPAAELKGMLTEDSLRAILGHVRDGDTRPDLVLATGDLSHDGSTSSYQRLLGYLAEFHVPVMAIPGNHDIPSVLQEQVLTAGFRGVGDLDLAGWHFIGLDSTVANEVHGRLAKSELQRLEDSLSAAEGRHTLVCLHHPPVPVGSSWMDGSGLDNADKLLQQVDGAPRVRVLLWGHVHQEFETLRGDCRLLATPSTCVQFRPGSEAFAIDSRPPGYRWLRLGDDGRVDTEVMRVSNPA